MKPSKSTRARYPWRPAKEKSMTIVAGFLSKNGRNNVPCVILGADSEESGNAINSTVRKIERVERPECTCLLAGAGNGDFIDLAIHEVRNELTAPFTHVSIREQIEKIVDDIYAQRIDSYPPHEQDDLGFQLLGAVWVKGLEKVEMIRVRRAFSVSAERPTTIGIGSDLARYIIGNLYSEVMTGYHATRLMVYLLAQVKKHVPDCGGNSQVMVLEANGAVHELWPHTIQQHEMSTSLVMDSGAKLLFHFADPMGFGYDMAKVDEVVDHISKQLKGELRRRLVAVAKTEASAESGPSQSIEAVVEPAPLIPTHDPKDPPPLPE